MDSLSRFINTSNKSLSNSQLEIYSDGLRTERFGNPRSSMSAPDLTPEEEEDFNPLAISIRPAFTNIFSSGKTLAQRSGGAWFDPRPSQTKEMVLAADPPGVWHYGFSAKSGRPGARIM
ncbi:hypothetical protein ElyMa_002334800 [Elysia marginata]|uniref:Uncharacterized protein n=1 Tax=Elysia marginata TaxID=1093978 RepID=A0AAV4G6X6_9GAST|nr:hypothetical protein ElyMa_002334800 [Elysia marginata]